MKAIRTCTVGAVALLATLLAGCGGGGNQEATSGAKFLPTVWTSDGRATNSCLYDSGCSSNPYAPFYAITNAAPPDGASLNGVVRLQIAGNELANVELLPANSYTPRYGVFNISADKTLAWLDFDTRLLPNGSTSLRISAFDKPAGQAGAREIVAMQPRSWSISNTALPAGAFAVTSTVAPVNNAIVKGTVHLEVHGNRIANVELIPATSAGPVYGSFNVSADRTYAWLDFDTRSLPDAARALRIAAYNVMPRQQNAQQIIAMPARTWNFQNGATAAFTGTITEAPLNGEILSGKVEFEVKGAGIKNAEMLPATGYSPTTGSFYTADDSGTIAHLDLDTTQLPNGPFTARVSLFNVPPGQAGAKEIIAMPARQWIIKN